MNSWTWGRITSPSDMAPKPRITRRGLLVGTAATAAFAGTPAFAQPKPVKIGQIGGSLGLPD